MSEVNAPFDIMPAEDDLHSSKKDQYVSLDIPLDPTKADGLKVSTKFKILSSPSTEDTLYFLSHQECKYDNQETDNLFDDTQNINKGSG